MNRETEHACVLRLHDHPIVEVPEGEPLTFTCDGREVKARAGEMIAAALIANGITAFRRTNRFHSPRGIFCGIGQCNDCVMVVDGVPNVRTCVTPVRAGMKVETQDGLGRFGAAHDL